MNDTTSSPLPFLPEDCNTGWKSQFGQPRGWLGALAGSLMARKNASMIRAAVELLDLKDDERVLEIGFGHGVGIAELARRVPGGSVAGVDPSQAMLGQASRRNRRPIAAGRARLALAGAGALGFEDAAFDAAIAVNSFQHWPDPAACLGEVRRVLRPGGRLLLALRMHEPSGGRFASPGFSEDEVDQVAGLLVAAGFEAPARLTREVGREMTALVAHRPGG